MKQNTLSKSTGKVPHQIFCACLQATSTALHSEGNYVLSETLWGSALLTPSYSLEQRCSCPILQPSLLGRQLTSYLHFADKETKAERSADLRKTHRTCLELTNS